MRNSSRLLVLSLLLSAGISLLAQSSVTIHYHRPAGDYAGWGLHLWGSGIDSGQLTAWGEPRYLEGEDAFGRLAVVDITNPSQAVNFIVHRENTKDTPNDRSFTPSSNAEIWLIQGDATVYTSNPYANGFARIHYYRPAGDYTGWGLHLWGSGLDTSELTTWSNPKPFAGSDSFGMVASVALANPAASVWFIVHKGNDKDTANDRSFIPANGDIWLIQGDSTVYTSNPNGPASGYARVHYRRDDANHAAYGLHLWGDGLGTGEATTWPAVKAFSSSDSYGGYVDIAIADGSKAVNLIVHANGSQDIGSTSFTPASDGYEVWLTEGNSTVFDTEGGATAASLRQITASARWATADTIGWILNNASQYNYTLYTQGEGDILIDGDQVLLGPDADSYSLSYAGDFSSMDPASEFYSRYAYLKNHGFSKLSVPAMSSAQLTAAVKGHLVVVARDGGGAIVAVTSLQRAGVLDDQFAYAGDDLGVSFSSGVPTIKLWAPNARNVRLLLWDQATSPSATTYSMSESNGVWSLTGAASWNYKYYQYEVETFQRRAGKVVTTIVTDPYSVSLSTNSVHTQIVDLNDSVTKPYAWDNHQITELFPMDAPEDITLYELHLRDFSILDDSVTAAYRGTYKAFTEPNSDGMQHLAALAAAGLTHVHLLPINDIKSVDEMPGNALDLTDPIESLYPGHPQTGQTILQVLEGMDDDSEDQQALMTDLRGRDGFNWGYDPYHFMAPEGSYATYPRDYTRVRECRKMIKSLHETGLRVVIDVVFNHTYDSGLLDNIVPDYYYRLNHDGNIENSSCCPDTASENKMFEKLVTDALVTWVKHYRVDGIRFDLMGHLTKATIARVRAELDALTLANDGVDGSAVYLYGEGWDFGSLRWLLPDSSAYQYGVTGTGVGTFNDRIRDAVKGKGQNPAELFNDDAFVTDKTTNRNQVLGGMRGTLWDWYGYVTDPQEAINYVTAHDKATMWDQLLAKVGPYASLDQMARMQQLAIGIVALSQGIPFFHAGMEVLRSKSGDENSYDSGDWFNQLSFDPNEQNWNHGLPPGWQTENHEAWDDWLDGRLGTISAAGPTQINATLAHFKEMLTIRKSSPLFRLRTMADIQARVSFPSNIWDPATSAFDGRLAVMKLDDTSGLDLDANAEVIWVLVNTSWDTWLNFYDDDVKRSGFQLHPTLQATANTYLKDLLDACCTGSARATAFTDHTSGGGTISVPPQTVLVYTAP